MTSAPSVSVILTSYQAAKTISRALSSIEDDVVAVGGEIVVVEDGSTDGTAEIVRRFAASSNAEVGLIEEGRLGRAGALNLAVERARGPLLANLDSDDISLPGRLQIQLAAMKDDPQLGMVGGSFVRVELDRNLAFTQSFAETDAGIRRSLGWTGPFCHSTVMYRRQAVVEAGGFSETERVRIDHDLWIRIGALGYRYRNLPDPLAIHFKTGKSFFARNSSERELAHNMFTRNRAAIQSLGLPLHLNLMAALRLGFRFVPEAVRLRITPRTSPLSASEVDTYYPGLVDPQPEPLPLLRVGEVLSCEGLGDLEITSVTQRNWSRVASAVCDGERFFVKQFVDRVGGTHERGFAGDHEVISSLGEKVCDGVWTVPVVGRIPERLLAISPYIEMRTIDSIGRLNGSDIERASDVGRALRTILIECTEVEDPELVKVWKGLDPKNVGWTEDGDLWIFDFGPSAILPRSQAAARVMAAGLLCRWVARAGRHVLWPERSILRAVCGPLADLTERSEVEDTLRKHAELRLREPQRTGLAGVATKLGLQTIGRLHWAAAKYQARRLLPAP